MMFNFLWVVFSPCGRKNDPQETLSRCIVQKEGFGAASPPKIIIHGSFGGPLARQTSHMPMQIVTYIACNNNICYTSRHIEVHMPWLVLSYNLPSATTSSPRVTLWRRLRRLGALASSGGIHILPMREECLEAFQWLAQEIRQAQGEALVMRVETFEGLTDAQLIELFCAARAKDYAEIDQQTAGLEAKIAAPTPDALTHVQAGFDRLRRRHAEITRVDYFDCPAGVQLAERLHRVALSLLPDGSTTTVPPAALAAYRDRVWVTRPRPHVDRLACAWLIRRYINPQAVIRYTTTPAPHEVAFDIQDAQFGHQGAYCTFETMLRAFGLDDAGLWALAALVHELDLRDGRTVPPEAAGVDAILQGWHRADMTDMEREAHGIALFDGLYAALRSRTTAPAHN
jgi:hypothetical protein